MPVYESSVFHILDYSNIKNSHEVIYSEPLIANGLTWRLKVYPNGNGIAKGNYLSIFLEMMAGLAEPSKYEYRVEMVNFRNPDVCIIREFASDFEIGECWGYNRFYRIDSLEQEGFLLPEDDKITLRYYVRAPNFA
jgi:tripartite motif-containing protein 37